MLAYSLDNSIIYIYSMTCSHRLKQKQKETKHRNNALDKTIIRAIQRKLRNQKSEGYEARPYTMSVQRQLR